MGNAEIKLIKRKMLETYRRDEPRYWKLTKEEILIFADYLEATNQPISAEFLRREAGKIK